MKMSWAESTAKPLAFEEFRGDGLCADQFAGATERVADYGGAFFVDEEVTIGWVDRNTGGRKLERTVPRLSPLLLSFATK